VTDPIVERIRDVQRQMLRGEISQKRGKQRIIDLKNALAPQSRGRGWGKMRKPKMPWSRS
jgi:hypothetical protein